MGVERFSHDRVMRSGVSISVAVVFLTLLCAKEAGAQQLRAEIEEESSPQLKFVVESDGSSTSGRAEPGATLRLASREPRECGVCDSGRLFDLDPWPWEAVFDPVCAFDEALFDETGSRLTDASRHAILGAAATVVPSIGGRFGKDPQNARLQLSWPWSLPIGPPMSVTRSYGTCRERTYSLKPIRLMLEPGIAWTTPLTLFVRPGMRFVFHPADWRLGIGAGVGSTLEARGPWGFRASLSPELLLHWGRCCKPGFVTLSLRYDRFFAGEEHDAVTTSIGFSFY
ncbi:MAG: hypothetical protein ACOX6T_19100 [Myxococcales bacterium]|jgi:hypothetical protein